MEYPSLPHSWVKRINKRKENISTGNFTNGEESRRFVWGNGKGIRLNVRKDPNSPIELYDLSKDIGEENNIASKHPQIVKKIELAMKESHVESSIFPFIK